MRRQGRYVGGAFLVNLANQTLHTGRWRTSMT